MKERQLSARIKTFVGKHEVGVYLGGLVSGWGVENALTGDVVGSVINGISATSLVGFEGIKAQGRKKYSRDGHEVFASKQVKNLSIQENPTIDLLQEHLGITFAQRPQKAELDSKNTFRLLRHGERGIHLKHRLEKGLGGAYYTSMNTYFTNGERSILVDLHENMHGYIAQKNPNITTVVVQQKNLAKYDIWEKQPSQFDPETYAVYFAVNEGVAEWAAETVFSDMYKKRKAQSLGTDDLIGAHDSDEACIAHFIETDGAFRIQKPSEKMLTTYKNGIDALAKAFVPSKNRLSRIGDLRRTFDQLQRIGKYIGDYFTQEIMTELMSERIGMTRKEVLDTLISTPPTTVEELAEPELYLLTLP